MNPFDDVRLGTAEQAAGSGRVEHLSRGGGPGAHVAGSSLARASSQLITRQTRRELAGLAWPQWGAFTLVFTTSAKTSAMKRDLHAS